MAKVKKASLRWRMDELESLRQLAPHKSNTELAAIFGRTSTAVATKVHVLELRPESKKKRQRIRIDPNRRVARMMQLSARIETLRKWAGRPD